MPSLPESLGANLATTFLTAWFCTIAEDRGLLPAQCFRTVRFGVGSVPALVMPDWRDCSLQHYGLFAWLRDVREGRKIREGTVQVIVTEGDKLVEIYQLTFTKIFSQLSVDGVQQQAECMLRKLLLCIAGLPQKDAASCILIRTSYSPVHQLTEIPKQGLGCDVGNLDLGSWQVGGYVWHL